MNITKASVTLEQAKKMMEIEIRCLDSEVFTSAYSTSILKCWKSSLTLDDYVNWSYTGWCFVAEELADKEQRTVAYGYLNTTNYTLIPEEYECYLQIQSLYVEPEYHRKGIGKRLMEELENEARREKCAKIGIRSSMPAVSFYEALGYKDMGEIWYDGFTAGKLELRLMIKEF